MKGPTPRPRSRSESRQLRRCLPAEGTVVELTLGRSQHGWRTRVEQLDGTRVLVVAPTQEDGRALEVPPATAAALTWPAQEALLRADGRLDGGDVDVVPRWWVDLDRVTRVQRRDAYRLRVARPVVLLVEGTHLSGVTEDLSEGGALVVVPAPLQAEAGQPVRVRLGLAEGEILLLDAEVVRVAPTSDGAAELGLRFRDLDGELADRVRRFVLAEQMRRRGGDAE